MKKLTIFITTLDRGGAERVTIYLADYMVKHGAECQIVTSTVGLNEYSVPDGINRIAISNRRRMGLKGILKLRSKIKEFKTDVLLIMGVSNCIYAIPATFGLNVKTIVSERNDPGHFAGRQYVKHLSRFLMRFADGFVFQTQEAKDYYSKQLKNRGEVISNPLFMDHLPEPCKGERRKEIVTAGRLIEQKNHKMLIDAFRIIKDDFPEYQLIIYGEGKLRPQLEMYISQCGLEERVSLPGNMPNVHQYINYASVFVMSSDFEGMPNALIESMALGLPTISTDCPCGGPSSLIITNINGVLVPVGDVEALAKALGLVLRDKKFAQRIGYAALEVRKSLNLEVIGKRWKDYLDCV